ncbi:MAG: hypothetical protein FD189_2179 [Elusimicrobia bacterium]|nr:MAG: hypothetical protein FD154_1589 [Elusimicrobiota bacterium]KAF0153931.1 MAG: hypothetical protein FD189_2179 [Elusimicrobiota bacterium]
MGVPELLRFGNLDGEAGLAHAVSTRAGGVSSGPYASLNVGAATGDEPENAAENLRRFLAAAGMPAERLAAMRQEHTANVAEVREDWPFGPPGEPVFQPHLDGLVTRLKNTPLIAFSADCATAVFYDRRNAALGVTHAGWRGAAQNIFRAAFERMALLYGSRPGDIIAGVGPCICAAHYPVGSDFTERLKGLFGPEKAARLLRRQDGGQCFDLRALLREQLLELGITNSEFSPLCTREDERLFSWRRDRGVTGRFALAAMLR